MEEVLQKLNQIQRELYDIKELVTNNKNDTVNNFNILDKRIKEMIEEAKREILKEMKS